ncbi:Cell division inhibitor SulA [Olavius algarvensis associated proteobacterium Delta 3]|nr:Cell division inhibitor SulA [Olavius algarvensis associated proteobacterium Delta 3]CAB5135577.1 Cell division inhibitor SulA [Olavius algarvensis associated proteobacterium Delta 3]
MGSGLPHPPRIITMLQLVDVLPNLQGNGGATMARAKIQRHENTGGVTVFYDGACPSCVRDRAQYEKLLGSKGADIRWFDITGQEALLREIGIDPHKALTELHVQDERHQVLSEMDAYILLLKKVPLLKPLAWLIGLPLIRPVLAKVYHGMVTNRLRRSGRL